MIKKKNILLSVAEEKTIFNYMENPFILLLARLTTKEYIFAVEFSVNFFFSFQSPI